MASHMYKFHTPWGVQSQSMDEGTLLSIFPRLKPEELPTQIGGKTLVTEGYSIRRVGKRKEAKA